MAAASSPPLKVLVARMRHVQSSFLGSGRGGISTSRWISAGRSALPAARVEINRPTLEDVFISAVKPE